MLHPLYTQYATGPILRGYVRFVSVLLGGGFLVGRAALALVFLSAVAPAAAYDSPSSLGVDSDRALPPLSGAPNIDGQRLAAEVDHLYAGEVAEFDAQGVLQHIRLGSSNGQGWPGDPLALAPFDGRATVRTSVANLDGRSERLGMPLMSAFLATLNQGADNMHAFRSEGQNSKTGVWSLVSGTGGRVAAWPVGNIVVDPGPDNLRIEGNGLVAVRSGNLAVTFAPTLVDPQGFAAAMAAAGATATMIQTDGTLHVVIRGLIHVVQPDWVVRADLAAPRGGVSLDGDGRTLWTDRSGNSQVLNPAFADLEQLLKILRAEDPTVVFNGSWRGEVSILLAGVPMVLAPDPFLILTPSAHRGQNWWSDGEKLYIHYPDYRYGGWNDLSQGFVLRRP